jgi:hypothetical protein
MRVKQIVMSCYDSRGRTLYGPFWCYVYFLCLSQFSECELVQFPPLPAPPANGSPNRLFGGFPDGGGPRPGGPLPGGPPGGPPGRY